MTEAEFKGQVIQLAELYQWKWYHPAISQFSVGGWPDLVLVRERLMIRELKTDKGLVSVKQRDWLDALRFANVDAAVWRPIDLTNGVIVQELSHRSVAA
jgi:hypothetical protein